MCLSVCVAFYGGFGRVPMDAICILLGLEIWLGKVMVGLLCKFGFNLCFLVFFPFGFQSFVVRWLYSNRVSFVVLSFVISYPNCSD